MTESLLLTPCRSGTASLDWDGMRLVRSGVRAGAICATLLLLAGCGSSSKRTDPRLGAPVVTRSATVKSDDGKSAKVLITVYRPARAGKIPRLPYSGKSENVCHVKLATDVVIPIGVRIVNTTPKLAPPLMLSLAVDTSRIAPASPYKANDELVEGSAVYPDGATCHFAGADYIDRIFLVQWKRGPTTGAAVTQDFVLVGHDYYSRKYPAGDPTYFKGLRLVPALDFGLDSDRLLGTLPRTTPIAPISVVPS
jgi:hypothetical protein